MSLSQPEIERIVREVMRRLQSSPAAAAASAVPPAPPGSGGAAAGTEERARAAGEAPQPPALTVAERLVTFELLRDRLATVRQVHVRPDAVVTPLVRDELRDRRIELVRAAQPLAAAAKTPVLLGLCAGGNVARRTVEATLMQCGARLEATWEGDVSQVVPRLTAALAAGRQLGVLVSPQPAANACWANRVAGIRGVQGTQLDVVRQAVRDMEANLLVVCPQSELLGPLVQAFLRPGPWNCPEPWKFRLQGSR
jgi:hypothetical protein